MCKLIVIILLNGQPLNKIDVLALTGAQKTCRVTYKGCLKELKIKGGQNYHAICSKE